MTKSWFLKALVGIVACGLVLGACSEGEDGADFNGRMLGPIADFKSRLLFDWTVTMNQTPRSLKLCGTSAMA